MGCYRMFPAQVPQRVRPLDDFPDADVAVAARMMRTLRRFPGGTSSFLVDDLRALAVLALAGVLRVELWHDDDGNTSPCGYLVHVRITRGAQ